MQTFFLLADINLHISDSFKQCGITGKTTTPFGHRVFVSSKKNVSHTLKNWQKFTPVLTLFSLFLFVMLFSLLNYFFLCTN